MTKTAPKSETKPRRTSEGSGKTKGAVSLAYINLGELLKIVKNDAQIPVGRVFAESLGFHVEQSEGGKPKLVLG